MFDIILLFIKKQYEKRIKKHCVLIAIELACLKIKKWKTKMQNQQDTAWKEVLDAYFKDFIHYCLPQLAEQIDWKKPIISLDKELQSITKGAKSGKRLLDKLFKVFLKDGTERCVLIHMEVQGKKEEDFPKRMFIYAYRIWDKYQLPLVSIAILTDDNPEWRPNHYEIEFAGSHLSAKFLTIKLLDYQNQKADLEHSKNPFASVILTQLAALECKFKSPEQRKNIKFALTRRLYDKGFSKQEITNLYRFIDWLIGLPEELEVDYLNDIYELEESKKMTYVSNAERFGIEKGRLQGRIEGKLEGKLEAAQEMLAEGFDPSFIARITKLPLDRIKALQKKKEGYSNTSKDREDQLS